MKPARFTAPKSIKPLLRILLLLLALPVAVQAQFAFVTNNATITITKYNGPGGDVTIPDTTNGLPITAIGIGAFYLCSALNTLALPDSVTSVDKMAFYGCGLTNVTIGRGVTNIGDLVFQNCYSLTGVYFRGNAPDLGGQGVFYGDTNMVYYLPGTKGWDATHLLVARQSYPMVSSEPTHLGQWPELWNTK